PGLVFSYALLPDNELHENFATVLKAQDGLSSASILGMLATMTAYNKCGYWVESLKKYIDENIQYTEEFLQREVPEIKVVPSQATYLMWLDISDSGISMTRLQDVLVHKGKVAIMDGKVYGGNGEQFLRFNVGCPRSKVIEGLQRLKYSIDSIEDRA